MYSPRFSEVVPPYTFMMEGPKWECLAQNAYDVFAFRLYQQLFLPLLNNKSNFVWYYKNALNHVCKLTDNAKHLQARGNSPLLVAVLKLETAIWWNCRSLVHHYLSWKGTFLLHVLFLYRTKLIWKIFILLFLKTNRKAVPMERSWTISTAFLLCGGTHNMNPCWACKPTSNASALRGGHPLVTFLSLKITILK